MELKNQVVSLELAKRLKELNCKQESLWWWVYYDPVPAKDDPAHGHYGDWSLQEEKGAELFNNHISAFTVSELGEMLPYGFCSYIIETKRPYWVCKYIGIKSKWMGTHNYFMEGFPIPANTEANARARMVIYLLENGLLNKKV